MLLEYFQMIDKVESVDLGLGLLKATSTVPMESPVFEGHFPGMPLVPGVLLIDTMAQASGMLMLAVKDFEAILTQTHASLVKQYQALLATEGVTLEFAPEGITRLAHIAFEVNERTENIGARRLSTVMERLLDEVSFDATRLSGQTITVDAAYVDARLQTLSQDEDLSRYIL